MEDTRSTGVVVGRFQVHELHEAHCALIQHVIDTHHRVIIFLGLSRVANTVNNPLSFESRRQMMLEEFPEVDVECIKDVAHDDVWSENLDRQIENLTGLGCTVTLYGGRDSFLSAYSGRYDTQEVISDVCTSGTDVRKRLGSQTGSSSDFRHGVVWAAASRFPTVFTTVDIAIFRDDYTKILLGRKEDENRYRLIGGFAQPDSKSFEHDAYREMQEETGLHHRQPDACMTYIGNFNIDDWRYRGETDGIRTILFACEPVGDPEPNDDIHELRWFDTGSLTRSRPTHGGDDWFPQVVRQHHIILYRALTYAIGQNVINQEVR